MFSLKYILHTCKNKLIFFRLDNSLCSQCKQSNAVKFCHTKCLRINLDKRFLPRSKTTTAWKLILHRSKISKNWNPPQLVLLWRFFKNWFLLIQKQLYNNYIQAQVKKFPMWRILFLADIRPMGYKLSCCGSICSG